ncbi:histidine phosphatase family protein [Paenibacillus terrae]|uniref:Phosphoglycerate kinase n=1 Tax=Paenibacillus terrae TaxID=159743 RepID=A0A0D7WXF3_9BACL|nr:histidine phosphatase family protein [Paenibacillus terrae]KJD43866.1 phosphoglycerate kinase [Paenibacillus terrae]
MMKIGFVRHGTTEWNQLGRMQGQQDTVLAEPGREQAQLLAERLALEEWDGILSSNLLRAQETAKLLSASSGIPCLGTDSRLCERGFGLLEGTTLQERNARWGEHWRQLDMGRESIESLLVRWDHFFEERVQAHDGRRMLLVSHGGFIEPVLAHRFNTEITGHVGNTSLSVTVLIKGRWCCELVNCMKHLALKLEQ